METENSNNYTSIIGTSYLHPIADLLQKLRSLDLGLPNEVQTSPMDNGYSSSVIILIVLMLESLIRRAQYLRDNNERIALKFVRSEFPEYDDIDILEELFVVRDIIAHNHVWEAHIDWDDERGMKFLQSLDEGNKVLGGDRKFDSVIDLSSRTTKRSGINIFPTKINRFDGARVLLVAKSFLTFLEGIGRGYVYISNQLVEIEGKPGFA